MNWLSTWLSFLGRKESQARIAASFQQIGQPVSTPANYEGFARQGYSKNVVVYMAISKIATACAGIDWSLFTKAKRGQKPTEIVDSPILTLLDRPNPLQGLSSFIEYVVAFYKLTGNSYIEANTPFKDKPPVELWPVRPDKMKVIPGANGYVSRYQFNMGGQIRHWDVDPVKLNSQILHIKSFNPTSDWYGMSALEAAMFSLDQYNSGQRWNLALLQNSATPSGVLQMKVSDANPRGELTNEQYARLRDEFKRNYQGAKNAGAPMIIEGGLSWQTVSMSPKDMDFLNNKKVTATDLALALGVPPELMGIGEKTFNNYREARLAFYEETVLPVMDFLRDELNRWLAPVFSENQMLDYDKDDIEALTWKREQKYTSLKDANFLTQNEKRVAAGYDEAEGWDVFVIGNQILENPEDAQTANPKDPNADPNQDPNAEGGSDDEPTKPSDDKPGGKPKPKDPNQSGDPNVDETDDGKGWKSINLLNDDEKLGSWRRQNTRRKRLAAHFERDLAEDFESLTKRLVNTANQMKGRDVRFIEFALYKDLQEWAPELKRTMAKNIKFTLQDFGQMILREGKERFGGQMVETKANAKYDHFVNEYIERRTGTQITNINNTNQKTIRRVVSEWTHEAITSGDSGKELSFYLQTEFEALTPGRAEKIARTEVASASNNGSLEAVKSLQVPNMFKEWVNPADERSRDGKNDGPDHLAMNGEEVPLDTKFVVPPDTDMDGPGDPSAPADQVINCRCVLVYRQRGTND